MRIGRRDHIVLHESGRRKKKKVIVIKHKCLSVFQVTTVKELNEMKADNKNQTYVCKIYKKHHILNVDKVYTRNFTEYFYKNLEKRGPNCLIA